jgi:hypothetical protein
MPVLLADPAEAVLDALKLPDVLAGREGPDGVGDAVTMTTACNASMLWMSCCENMVVLIPRSELSGTLPLCVIVQIKSAEVIAPFQLQPMSSVHAPGVGSLRWNSHVDGPCLSVNGSQTPSSSSSSSSLFEAEAVGADAVTVDLA